MKRYLFFGDLQNQLYRRTIFTISPSKICLVVIQMRILMITLILSWVNVNATIVVTQLTYLHLSARFYHYVNR